MYVQKLYDQCYKYSPRLLEKILLRGETSARAYICIKIAVYL